MKQLSNDEIKAVVGGSGLNDPSEFLRLLEESRRMYDEDMRRLANQGAK